MGTGSHPLCDGVKVRLERPSLARPERWPQSLIYERGKAICNLFRSNIMRSSLVIDPGLGARGKDLIGHCFQEKTRTEGGMLTVALRALMQSLLDCLKFTDLSREPAIFKQPDNPLLLLPQRPDRELLPHRPSLAGRRNYRLKLHKRAIGSRRSVASHLGG